MFKFRRYLDQFSICIYLKSLLTSEISQILCAKIDKPSLSSPQFWLYSSPSNTDLPGTDQDSTPITIISCLEYYGYSYY